MASDVEAVRAANKAYYAALSARDLVTMEQLWSRSPDDVNVAPPIRPVAHIGWAAVKGNYEEYWSSLDALNVSMDNPRSKCKATLPGFSELRRLRADSKTAALVAARLSTPAYS